MKLAGHFAPGQYLTASNRSAFRHAGRLGAGVELEPNITMRAGQCAPGCKLHSAQRKVGPAQAPKRFPNLARTRAAILSPGITKTGSLKLHKRIGLPAVGAERSSGFRPALSALPNLAALKP